MRRRGDAAAGPQLHRQVPEGVVIREVIHETSNGYWRGLLQR